MEPKITLTRRIRFLAPKEAQLTPEEVTQMITELLRRVKSVDRQVTKEGKVYAFKDEEGNLLKEIHESKQIHPLWREAIRRVEKKIKQVKRKSA